MSDRLHTSRTRAPDGVDEHQHLTKGSAMQHTLKIGLALVVVAAIAMSGIALAQTGSDTTSPTAAVQALPGYERLLDKLAPLVDAGTISQDQADAVAETLLHDMGGPGPRGRGLEAVREGGGR